MAEQLIARRRFLRDSVLVAGGFVAGSWLRFDRFPFAGNVAADDKAAIGAEARLKELKIELPEPGKPSATLVPAVRSGNMLYVSGHGPRAADGGRIVGKVGRDMDTKQAAEAARSVALAVLSAARGELGSLDKIVRVVKVLGMVNCTPDFNDTPLVINGFSQLLIDIFGEQAGKGARSAVGMVALPGGIPVEIEAIFEVRD